MEGRPAALRSLLAEGRRLLADERLDLELAVPVLDSGFDQALQDKALSLSQDDAEVYLRRWALDQAAVMFDRALAGMTLPAGARMVRHDVTYPDPDHDEPVRPHVHLRVSITGLAPGEAVGMRRDIEAVVRSVGEKIGTQSFWDRGVAGRGDVDMAAR